MIEQDCRRCTNWRLCPGKESYLFAYLRWCPYQILWVLANSETLHSGKWPPQYSPFEEPRKKQLNEEGYFVKPAIIIAEVEKRLETCGTPGKLLIREAQAGEALETLSDEAFSVVLYVKGWRRKETDFNTWRRHYRK